MSKCLKPGDIAPQFELFDQNLNKFNLKDYLGKKAVVIFFYPKDETRTCTREVCSFRDNYIKFNSKDVEVVGISSDSIETHQEFAGKHHLPFRILSDGDNSVRKLYGVSKVLGIIAGRETFIINKQGRIVKTFSDLLHGEQHVEEALEAIEEMVNSY